MENNYKVYCHLFPNGKRYIGTNTIKQMGENLKKKRKNLI